MEMTISHEIKKPGNGFGVYFPSFGFAQKWKQFTNPH